MEEQYKIVIASTGNVTLQIIDNINKHTGLYIAGVIVDETVESEKLQWFYQEIEKRNLKIITFQDLVHINPAAVFACEYRKIIDPEWVNQYLFLNLHAGILPVYRGFNANAWAIINGSSEIGYTIHKMNESFDSGDIYYVYRMEIKECQTYGDVHGKLLNHMIENAGKILERILRGEITSSKQEGGYILCEHLRRQDGELKNFDVDSSYLYNLYRCFARPLGTGVYFFYRGHKYETRRVRCGTYYGVVDYIAFPGRIVNVTEDEIWIKTKNNVICFGEIFDSNEKAISTRNFQIGSNLGNGKEYIT